MKKRICLLMAIALLLTGCGGNAPAEKEAPATEPVVTTEPTTEPTTMPTEPKTFFEEQGFTFWEGFKVYDTQDGGILAQAKIPESTECKVTITCGNREENTYHLADTEVKVFMDEYSLAEFDEACKEEKLSTENIKNASDSLYKAFAEENSSLTKETWLEQYSDYKVIHCQINQIVRTAREVQNAKLAMNIGQSQWRWNARFISESISVMNCIDGTVYETSVDDYPGMPRLFSISTEVGMAPIAVVADFSLTWIDSERAEDVSMLDDLFVMVPNEDNMLAFILPLAKSVRAEEKFDAVFDEEAEIPWYEKSFAEYKEGKDFLKYYFLSPNHH